jgi:hypothetical protein
VAVNYIGGGNRSTRRKPLICSKLLTKENISTLLASESLSKVMKLIIQME